MVPVPPPPPVADGSNRTTLSVLVEAVFGLPAAFAAAPAGTLTTTVPADVIPVTATV